MQRRKRNAQKREHIPTESERRQHADDQREYRANKKVADSLEQDRIRSLERKVEDLTREVRRLQDQLATVNSTDAVAEEAADDSESSSGIDGQSEESDFGAIEEEDVTALIKSKVFGAVDVNDIVAAFTSTERLCRRMIHHSPEQWQQAMATLLPYVAQTNDRGLKRRRSGTWRLSDETQLFIFLFYAAHYPTYTVLAHVFFTGEGELRRVLHRVSAALADAASVLDRRVGGIKWPTAQEWDAIREEQRDLLNPGLEDIDMAIDGIHIGVRCPNDMRQVLWYNKEKRFSVAAVVGVTLRGHFVFASDVVDYNDEGRLILDEHFREILLETGVGCVTDARYTLNKKCNVRTNDTVPFAFTVGSKTRDRLLQAARKLGTNDPVGAVADQLLTNSDLASQMRVVSENAIQRLRSWRILAGVYRSYGKHGRYSVSIDDMFKALVLVTNVQLFHGGGLGAHRHLRGPRTETARWHRVGPTGLVSGPRIDTEFLNPRQVEAFARRVEQQVKERDTADRGRVREHADDAMCGWTIPDDDDDEQYATQIRFPRAHRHQRDLAEDRREWKRAMAELEEAEKLGRKRARQAASPPLDPSV